MGVAALSTYERGEFWISLERVANPLEGWSSTFFSLGPYEHNYT